MKRRKEELVSSELRALRYSGVCGVGRLLGGSPQPRSTFVASYLVDPASSHMLVSKIKPCMSKYIPA